MEPGNSSEAHEINYNKYQDLKEQLNEEMNKWAFTARRLKSFYEITVDYGYVSV